MKRELVACLRRHHFRRKPRRRGAKGQLKDMVLVDQRPPEVESRLIAGHYEGDLILGAGNRSAVGVLVERTMRHPFLCHLPQRDATSVREAFTRKLQDIPAALRLSLTYDQAMRWPSNRPSPPTSASRGRILLRQERHAKYLVGGTIGRRLLGALGRPCPGQADLFRGNGERRVPGPEGERVDARRGEQHLNIDN